MVLCISFRHLYIFLVWIFNIIWILKLLKKSYVQTFFIRWMYSIPHEEFSINWNEKYIFKMQIWVSQLYLSNAKQIVASNDIQLVMLSFMRMKKVVAKKIKAAKNKNLFKLFHLSAPGLCFPFVCCFWFSHSLFIFFIC